MDSRLSNPDISPDILVDLLIAELSKNPTKLSGFIRGYSNFIVSEGFKLLKPIESHEEPYKKPRFIWGENVESSSDEDLKLTKEYYKSMNEKRNIQTHLFKYMQKELE